MVVAYLYCFARRLYAAFHCKSPWRALERSCALMMLPTRHFSELGSHNTWSCAKMSPPFSPPPSHAFRASSHSHNVLGGEPCTDNPVTVATRGIFKKSSPPPITTACRSLDLKYSTTWVRASSEGLMYMYLAGIAGHPRYRPTQS